MAATAYDTTTTPPNWFALPIVAIGFAIAVAVGRSTANEALACAVGGTAGMVLTLLLFTRGLWRHPWFWMFFAAVLAAHALLIAIVPWPNHHDLRRGDAVFVLVDFLAVFGTLDLVQRALRRRSHDDR